MSKTRQDSTILLQAGLNGLNQALTATEIKYFVPIYDDLIDPNVRISPLETSACVSSATRGLNTLTPNDIRGAYFFKHTTETTQKWTGDVTATSGWSYYSDSTGGYTSIQGELTCWKSGNAVSAASCYGGTSAVSGASISDGVITGSPATQFPTEASWDTTKLYDSVVYAGQRSTEDSAVAQYAVNINSKVTGEITFNKLLVFSRCSGGSYQPLTCIALAEPISVKNDGTGLSDITIEFSINFTANLSNIPINVISNTSGYWYYTAKTEGVDSVNPLFTPGRVKIGAFPFPIDTSAFVTMGGVGTSGLRFVDIFISEDEKCISFRNTMGGIGNVGGNSTTATTAINGGPEDCYGSVISLANSKVGLPSSSLLIGCNNIVNSSANEITVIGNNNTVGENVTRSYIFGDKNENDIVNSYTFDEDKKWPTFIFGSNLTLSDTSAMARQFKNTVGGQAPLPVGFEDYNFRYEYNFFVKTPDYSTSNRSFKIGACAIQTSSTSGNKTQDTWFSLIKIDALPTYDSIKHYDIPTNNFPAGAFIIQEIGDNDETSAVINKLKGKKIICSYVTPPN